MILCFCLLQLVVMWSNVPDVLLLEISEYLPYRTWAGIQTLINKHWNGVVLSDSLWLNLVTQRCSPGSVQQMRLDVPVSRFYRNSVIPFFNNLRPSLKQGMYQMMCYLHPGAHHFRPHTFSDDELLACESRLGFRLPLDMYELYRSAGVGAPYYDELDDNVIDRPDLVFYPDDLSAMSIRPGGPVMSIRWCVLHVEEGLEIDDKLLVFREDSGKTLCLDQSFRVWVDDGGFVGLCPEEVTFFRQHMVPSFDTFKLRRWLGLSPGTD